MAVSFRREKVRPARSKHPTFGVFVLAGRVFSRKSHWRGRAGRVISRQPVLRLSVVGVAVHFRWLRWGFCAMRSPLAACRRLGWRHSPRLVAARPRLEVVWPPKCRPIGQKSLKMACFCRMGLHFGGFAVCRGVLFAREPAIASLSPLYRTQTRY